MGRRSKSNISRRNTPPPPSNNNQSIGSTVLGNIFTGITFGAGSSLGHRAIDGIMGNREVDIKQPDNNQNEVKQNNGLSCEKIFDVYQLCLKENNNCQYLEDMIKLKCS